MNRVREASTMSVPTMRQMLGLKKTASYWLIKKQWFDVLTIHGEMRVVISSFETWYANQTHYRKVNGPPPGEELRKKSYSVKDISNLLGIGIDTVYDLIHREKIPYSVYQYGQWRVDAAVFQFWYNSQCTYHLVTAEHPNELHKANHKDLLRRKHLCMRRSKSSLYQYRKVLLPFHYHQLRRNNDQMLSYL